MSSKAASSGKKDASSSTRLSNMLSQAANYDQKGEPASTSASTQKQVRMNLYYQLKNY
jgi:hypothetical protein